LVTSSDELAGKLALNQDTWDKEEDPNIVIVYDDKTSDLTPEEIEEDDEVNIRASVSMYTDYSQEILEKTGKYLRDDANIDILGDRIIAQLEKYVAAKLKEQQGLSESRKRVRIHVKR
jgi:hypothetical protein